MGRRKEGEGGEVGRRKEGERERWVGERKERGRGG